MAFSSAHISGDSNLLRLPDELLVEIVALAVDHRSFMLHDLQRREWYKTVWSLTLVCKRISGLAYPLLYHTISFQSTTLKCLVPPSDAAKLLLRSLRGNPALGTLCVDFRSNNECDQERYYSKVFVHGDSDDDSDSESADESETMVLPSDYDTASAILGLLPNVKTFDSYAGFPDMRLIARKQRTAQTQRMWAMLSLSFRSMPLITTLMITPNYGYVDLSEIVFLVDLPVLRRLHVDRGRLHARRLGIVTTDTTEVLRGRNRAAPFTELSLHNYFGRFEILPSFIRWPKVLEKLSLTAINSHVRLETLQELLDSHRPTLKSLRLDVSGQGGDEMDIQLTDFPSLHDLHLSSKHYREPDDLGSHASKLAPPNLHCFTWEFNHLTAYPEPLHKGEVEALRNFVDIVRSRGCPLQRIHIMLWPTPRFRTWRKRGIEGSRHGQEATLHGEFVCCKQGPRDRMEELARQLSVLGVDLTWDIPRMVSNEEYAEAVKQWRAWMGDLRRQQCHSFG